MANDGLFDSDPATVQITVNPVNDTPSFTKGADQTVDEDAGAQTVANWATAFTDGDPEVVQALSFTVTNNNNGLFSVQPSIAPDGTLSYTPAANANGSATVTVTLTDDATAGGAAITTAAQTFQITVNPVNDTPSFTKGADQTVDGGRGSPDGGELGHGNHRWRPGGRAGLSFTVTNDNNGLFCGAAVDGTRRNAQLHTGRKRQWQRHGDGHSDRRQHGGWRRDHHGPRRRS